jgi:riboflavin-specific deaminase-like protein
MILVLADASIHNHNDAMMTSHNTTTMMINDEIYSIIEESIKDIKMNILQFKKRNPAATYRRRRPRPFVTLSYAQSLDGKIALKKKEKKINNSTSSSSSSSNFAISSQESLYLTHALRSLHDGILIGKNTLLCDNPRLNNRLWIHNNNNNNNKQQPRPIVLDTNLCCISNSNEGCGSSSSSSSGPIINTFNARNLILCCSQQAYEKYQNKVPSNITLLPCKATTTKTTNNNESLDLHDVLEQLYDKFNIHSLMVEGGANVLTEFITTTTTEDQKERGERGKPIVDYLCVTISPILLGENYGLSSITNIHHYQQRSNNNSNHVPTTPEVRLGPITHSIILGGDCIIFCNLGMDDQP